MSDETGREEIYVRPFPGPGGKWVVSLDGGIRPAWAWKVHKLFFQSPNGRMMAADFETNGDIFAVKGKPYPFAESRTLITGVLGNYDVAPDGKRIAAYVLEDSAQEQKGNLHMTFLLNFFDELKRRIP